MPTHSAVIPAETIRSRHNSQLKNLRWHFLHPARCDDGQIAIEGEHLVQEAMRSDLQMETLFVREDWTTRADWTACGASQIVTVSVDVFNHACMTESPQGIAALVQIPTWTFESLLQTKNSLLLVIAGLQDPGNLGTIIRSAEAFGAAGILLTPGTVHIWNQKVLRASAGSSFRMPVVSLKSENELDRLQAIGVPLYAATMGGDISIDNVNLQPPIALAIGNEGAGVPQAVLRYCAGTVHIPCTGPVESLNAAVAASILLYEASLQRAAKRNL